MNLLLWRHAEAVDSLVDLERRLSPKGCKQAQRTADWLRIHQPPNLRILVSPAVRARETVATFSDQYEIVPSLAPGALPVDLLNAAKWPEHGGSCLIVGHQPTLGLLAAYLLGGREDYLSVRKNSLWWFSSRARDGQQCVLRCVIHHDYL